MTLFEKLPDPPEVEGHWRCTNETCGTVTYRAPSGSSRGVDPRFRFGKCWRCKKRVTFKLVEDVPPPAAPAPARDPGFVQPRKRRARAAAKVPRNRAAGEREKEVGMRAAEFASTPSGWVEAFDHKLAEYAEATRYGGWFTSEDVTEKVGQPPSPGAVGARMNAAARRGLIVHVGHAKASRANQHATEIRTWRGAPE